MARYYFERAKGSRLDADNEPYQPEGWDILDCHDNLRVGTLHDIVLTERVVDLLNKYEERYEGR